MLMEAAKNSGRRLSSDDRPYHTTNHVLDWRRDKVAGTTE
jgi:hypothetical protein